MRNEGIRVLVDARQDTRTHRQALLDPATRVRTRVRVGGALGRERESPAGRRSR